MLYVVKRDGRRVRFDSSKVFKAIKGAADEIGYIIGEEEINKLKERALKKLEALEREELSVEDIQNKVEDMLLSNGHREIGVAYSNYRRERNRIREIKSDLMKAIDKIGVETDRDNGETSCNKNRMIA